MLEGTNIGQYRIIRRIGSGGMGTVFLAEHVLLGRRAAIKSLLPAFSRQHEIVERFFNEARAATAVRDPGIVQVYDYGVHVDGTAYIVMELLEGETLCTRIARLGRIAPVDTLRIIRQTATALAAAHDAEIVHRDLKPENVFLVRDPEAQAGERPKILDFGIAKLTSPNEHARTHTDAVMGTPVYMSPEQCRGAGFVDHRSDIYSLGCVMFHMLTGRPPFDGDGSGDLIAAHLREDPRRPSTLVGAISPTLDALVLRCLAKAAGDRYQTMAQLRRATEIELASNSSVEAASRPTTLGSASGQLSHPAAASSGRTLARVMTALLIAAGVATGVLYSRRPRKETAPATTAAAGSVESPVSPVAPPDGPAEMVSAASQTPDAAPADAEIVEQGVDAPPAAAATHQEHHQSNAKPSKPPLARDKDLYDSW